jgi:gluconate 2-dehydrogenase gamma chain
MNRRQLLRTSLFGAAGAAAAREFPANYDESKELARADWKPSFFSDHQNQTVIVLGELIIPETDTPGATTALVNRFLDLLLAAETHDTQQSFLNSLAYLDGEARSRYGNALIYLPKETQVELLEFFAYPNSLETWGEGQTGDQGGHNHFQNIKDWIARIFFSSEAGMKALGWNGEFAHGTLAGCDPNEKKAPSRAF